MKMRSVRKLCENTCVNKCAHSHAHAHNTFNCIYIYIEGGREGEREREREKISMRTYLKAPEANCQEDIFLQVTVLNVNFQYPLATCAGQFNT